MKLSTLIRKQDLAQTFQALADSERLEIYRLLLESGPSGLSAGEIADRLAAPASTLSFRLASLRRARLVSRRKEGRFIVYALNFEMVDTLVALLDKNDISGRFDHDNRARAPAEGSTKKQQKGRLVGVKPVHA